MKIKLILFLVFVLMIGLISLKQVSSKSKQEQLKELDNAEDKNTISWYVRRARVTGDTQVSLPSYIGIPAEVKDLNDALSNFKVIAAEPIEKCTISSQWSLLTWYKFKVVEDFSRDILKECRNCLDSIDDAANLPEALLPLKEDEILVPQPGGTLTIDGIKVFQPSEVPVDFSAGSISASSKTEKGSTKGIPFPSHYHLSNSKRFLLFLGPSKSGKVGILSFISRGIFLVGPEGELEPIDDKPDIIKSQLSERSINTFDQLKQYTQRMQ